MPEIRSLKSYNSKPSFVGISEHTFDMPAARTGYECAGPGKPRRKVPLCLD